FSPPSCTFCAYANAEAHPPPPPPPPPAVRLHPLTGFRSILAAQTSFLGEAVYGIFSASCMLILGLSTFPGVRLPRGFLLKQQLAKCLLSTVALLAIEWWRHVYANRSSGIQRTGDTCNGDDGGLRDGPGWGQGGTAALRVPPGGSNSDVTAFSGSSGRGSEGCGVESSTRQDGSDAQQQLEQGSGLREHRRRQQSALRPVRVIRMATRCECSNGGREDPWVAFATLFDRQQYRSTIHARIQAAYRLGLSASQTAATVACTRAPAPEAGAPPLPLQHQQPQPQGVPQLHARPLLPYTPFSLCLPPDDHRGLPRQGEGAFGTPFGGSHVQQRTAEVPVLPAVPLNTNHNTPHLDEGVGEAAAALPQSRAHMGEEQQQQQQQQSPCTQVPKYVPYRGRTMLYSTRLKVDGWEPEQVAPGYQRRIARVLANAGLQLEAVTLRRGCIEMVIETRAVTGDPLVEDGGTTAAGAAAATAPEVCGGVQSSPDRGSGTSNDPFHGVAAANPQRLEAFEDVLDIGAIIRALELPDSASLESDMGLSGGVEGEYGTSGGEVYVPRGGTTAASDAEVLPPQHAAGFLRSDFPYSYPGHPLPSLSHFPSGIAQPGYYEEAVAAHDVSGTAATTATARGDCLEGGTWAAAYLRVGDDAVDREELQPPSSSRTAYNFQEVADEGLMATAEEHSASPSRPSVRSGLAAAAAAAAAAAYTATSGSALHRPSSRMLPSGLVGLPYVLDIFPRVLVVGTTREDTGPMPVLSQQQEEQGAEQMRQTILHGTQHDVGASETLILAVAWVTWSREGRRERAVANVNADANAPSTVPPTAAALSRSLPTDEQAGSDGSSFVSVGKETPLQELVLSAAEAKAEGAAPAATEVVAAGASSLRSAVEHSLAGAPLPTLSPAAGIGTAAAGTDASTELIPALHPSVAWDAAVAAPASEPQRTRTQIMFRFHGELVAVALVEPVGRGAAGVVIPEPPPSELGVAAGGGSASSPETGPVGTSSQHRQLHVPFAEEAGLAGVPALAAAAEVEEEEEGGDERVQGGSVVLGGEAVYSVALGQLLAQLRPGALLVEAHQVQGGIANEATAATAGDVSADPDADRPGPAVVPLLLVDDPRVCAELQMALDNWRGTVDEMDCMLYDMGALLWLQDNLGACTAATAVGDGGGNATVRLRALSARTQRLHDHLLAYAEALYWTETQRWLRTRQQAVTAAVAAAVAAAVVECTQDNGPGAATACSIDGSSRGQMPGGEASGDDGLSGHPVHQSSWVRCLLAAARCVRRMLRVVDRLLRLLQVVLGWRSEGDADTAAYMSYTAVFATNMMNVMQVMDVIGFLSVMVRGSTKPSSNGGSSGGDVDGRTGSTGLAWLDPDKACVLVAASTGAVMGALWLMLPNGTWRRISARAKWPRQVSYTLSKAMVAFLGFPQPAATIRHELGMSIFVLEGVILPAGVLMSPLESVFMGLIRAPLCARMWLLSAGSTFTITTAMARALALSALNVLTTVVVHMYIRVSYERQRRGAAQHAKAD
ncbi:hypothetical protein Vretifemale_18153, partial [Volvox reticuliferus]